jgi:hypothetical protein
MGKNKSNQIFLLKQSLQVWISIPKLFGRLKIAKILLSPIQCEKKKFMIFEMSPLKMLHKVLRIVGKM